MIYLINSMVSYKIKNKYLKTKIFIIKGIIQFTDEIKYKDYLKLYLYYRNFFKLIVFKKIFLYLKVISANKHKLIS